MENIVGKYASYFAHLINVWKLILANAMAFAHVTGLLKRAGSLRGFAEAVAPVTKDNGVPSAGLLVTPGFSWETLGVGGARPRDKAVRVTEGRILPTALIMRSNT